MPLVDGTNWFFIGVVVSIILYLLIGGYAGRLVKNVEDYYVAGRNAPTILIVGSLVASFLGVVSFLGEMGFSYSGYPIVMLILMPLNVSGYAIGAYFFGRYIYQMEPVTLLIILVNDSIQTKCVLLLHSLLSQVLACI